MKISHVRGECYSLLKLFLTQHEGGFSWVFLINPYKFMSGCLYFPNNLGNIKDYL